MQKRSWFVALVVGALMCTPVLAQPTGPDVIVSASGGIAKNGTVSGITAYSMATTSCNIGDMVAIWIDSNNQHPVIAGTMYRLKDGLMEQIGIGWLKHGFCAVNEFSCGACQTTPCSTLGLNCADTYGTGLNGSQSNLGPRYQVNASTGFFNYPFATQGQTGNAIYKRTQVNNNELNPSLNPGALYFGVLQYITTDETAWGNMFNNNSYRRLNVGSFSGGGYNMFYTGSTFDQADPITAWEANDTGVTRFEVATPETSGLGQLVIGHKVTDNGDGTFTYNYAIFNNNSHNSVRGLSIPLPNDIVLSDIYFNDANYHSGSPHDNTDWVMDSSGGAMTWMGNAPVGNGNSQNALRWGTTNSFRFTAPAPPEDQTATITMFRGGEELNVTLPGPSGDFTLAPTDLVCLYSGGTATMTWNNAEDYTEVRILRDGTEIAVLPGTATSYDDDSAPVGQHIYGVQGVLGNPSGAVTCSIEVLPPPPLVFDYQAPGGNASYDVVTGIGSFSGVITVAEDASNNNFPNAIFGFSMALGNDDAILNPTTVEQGSAVSSANGGTGPEFWAPVVYANGITVGVVFDFQGGESILADSVSDLVEVSYETNAANLAGNDQGVDTVLNFVTDLGVPAVPNSIVLALGADADPVLNAGLVSLQPGAGAVFLRGDDDGNGSIGLTDPIYSLNYQFTQGGSVCLAAMDFNDDGVIGLPDPISNLNYQFVPGSPPPPAPFPSCGSDPTSDVLTCVGPVVCP